MPRFALLSMLSVSLLTACADFQTTCLPPGYSYKPDTDVIANCMMAKDELALSTAPTPIYMYPRTSMHCIQEALGNMICY